MKRALLMIPGLLLAGCATLPPDGPSRMALPGTGKSFDQFRVDESSCRQYGMEQSGISPKQASNDSMVKSAAVGTVVGGVLGAAVGGNGGAAVGAGTGLLVGTVTGADAGSVSAYDAQERYDNAYIQCMYAKGHKVPVSGNIVPTAPGATPSVMQTRSTPPPPPPPGYKGPPPSPTAPPPDYRP